MKRIFLLAVAFITLHITAFAQNEFNSFSATGRGGVMNTFVHDYQAIGVNPANLGRSTSIVAFTIGEGGLGASTQAITKATMNTFMQAAQSEELSLETRRQLAKAFTNDNVLNVGADFNTFAISVNLPKIGGFAFSNRQRGLGHVAFDKNFAELVFLGKDAELYNQYAPGETVYVSKIFNGTEIKTTWLNEWNFSFGRKVIDLPFINIYAGAGYRYIQGMAIYEFSSKDGVAKAYSASSPIMGWNYDQYMKDPKFSQSAIDGVFNPVGNGHGFDVGLSAEVLKIIKLSASVTDIGSMSWTKNLLEAKDNGFKLPEFEGSQSYTFQDAAITAITLIDSSLVFSPVSEVTTELPTRFRAGAGIKLGNRVEIGMDYVKALNNAPGNITEDFMGVGIDVKALPFIRLSTGVSTGAGDKLNLPVGFAIVTPVYEFGVSTRNIMAPLSDTNPGASFAMGFLRFKIGKPQIL
jgi:hypothetical protein